MDSKKIGWIVLVAVLLIGVLIWANRARQPEQPSEMPSSEMPGTMEPNTVMPATPESGEATPALPEEPVPQY